MMKKGLATFLLMLISLAVSADPLDGTLRITGGYVGSSAALTGDINRSTNELSLDPSFVYGATATFEVSELLDPGTYTRSYTLSTGAVLNRTETIPSGKVGGYYVVEVNNTWYQVFNAWSVSSDGRKYTPVTFPGNILTNGPLSGKRLNLDFTVPPPPAPTMSLSIDVSGGLTHECTSPQGSTISVSAEATIEGDTTLDRIDWYLDSVFAGSGNAMTLDMSIGDHNLQAVGIATDGVTSASDEVNISVEDTVAPTLEISFLNQHGQPVTSASVGNYTVRLNASDTCDLSPVVNASAMPVLNVTDGDTITINSTSDVQLPTTAVEVTATARDANGQVGRSSATLTIQ